MDTIDTQDTQSTAQAHPIRSLEEAAKKELRRKATLLRERLHLSADAALEQAERWQQEEIGQSDVFELTPSKKIMIYRVWYRRTGAIIDEQVLIKTDTALQHWPAISDLLAYRIGKTHDAQCEYVATFVQTCDSEFQQ